MASKRAVQLFSARANASVVGRQTSRPSFAVTRAFSLAPRSQPIYVSESRASGLGNSVRLHVAPAQKRWHSQTPDDLKKNKVYQFDDVSFCLLPKLCLLISSLYLTMSTLQTQLILLRSSTFSNTPPTPAFSSMSANPMNSRPILSPHPSTSPSHHSQMRYC